MHDVIGETLSGRYRIERLLGRGGMSAVWLAGTASSSARSPSDLHSRRLESAERSSASSARPARWPRLAHPGIVTVIDRGEEDGRPYIVFEYVRGPDLRSGIATRAGSAAKELRRRLAGSPPPSPMRTTRASFTAT